MSDDDLSDVGKKRDFLQIGTRELFFLMAIFCVIACSFSRHWMTVGNFVGTVLFCLLVGGLYSWLASGIALVVISILVVGLEFNVAAMIILLTATTPVWVKLSGRSNLTAKGRFHASLCFLAGGLLCFSFVQPKYVKELYEARAAYPFVDLSPRLQYEKESIGKTAGKLSSAVEDNLKKMELWMAQSRRRKNLLREFHDQKTEQFVRAFGFGESRMGLVRKSLAETPKLSSIGFRVEKTDLKNFTDEDSYDWTWKDVVYVDFRPDDSTELDLFEGEHGFHFLNVRDFVLPTTFGYVESPKKVAGFIPHAFHFPQQPPDNLDGYEWYSDSLYLISLENFDQPRVYLLDSLPRMDHLSSDDTNTRDLDDFETKALPRLESSEDVVVLEGENEIRMLGSIRASTNCLDCHEVNRGDLLGAFTYRFLRKK